MLFLVKKVLASIFQPSSLIFFLFIISFILLILKKKAAKLLLGLTIVFYYILSTPVISFLFLKGLENRFPFLESPPEDVRYVVVLSGGNQNSLSDLPLTSRLNSYSVARVLEGVRLYKKMQDGYLVLSGEGWVRDPEQKTCSLMKKLSLFCSVPEERIILECNSRDTYDEAKEIKKILGDQKFLLVTSAFHMPRSMLIFKKMGLNAIPAPGDFRAQGKGPAFFRDYFPRGMDETNLALIEYLGILFYKVFY